MSMAVQVLFQTLSSVTNLSDKRQSLRIRKSLQDQDIKYCLVEQYHVYKDLV